MASRNPDATDELMGRIAALIMDDAGLTHDQAVRLGEKIMDEIEDTEVAGPLDALGSSFRGLYADALKAATCSASVQELARHRMRMSELDEAAQREREELEEARHDLGEYWGSQH